MERVGGEEGGVGDDTTGGFRRRDGDGVNVADAGGSGGSVRGGEGEPGTCKIIIHSEDNNISILPLDILRNLLHHNHIPLTLDKLHHKSHCTVLGTLPFRPRISNNFNLSILINLLHNNRSIRHRVTVRILLPHSHNPIRYWFYHHQQWTLPDHLDNLRLTVLFNVEKIEAVGCFKDETILVDQEFGRGDLWSRILEVKLRTRGEISVPPDLPLGLDEKVVLAVSTGKT